MSKLPDAQDARQKLDAIIKDWQNELKKIEDQMKAKLDDYDKRKLIMTEQTRSDLEDQIKKIDQQITEYSDKKFGANGKRVKEQEDLMKPVQNKIFKLFRMLQKMKAWTLYLTGVMLLFYCSQKINMILPR